MKKSLGITAKFSIIVTIAVFVMMGIITGVSYKLSYDQVMEAAGIELVGCANITTGIIDPRDIEALSEGNMEKAGLVSEQINWTVEHKPIFTGQYILSLDGKLLAADELIQKQGFAIGDSFYIDADALALMLETKHTAFSKVYEFGGKERITGYAPIFQDHDMNKRIIAFNAIDFDASIVPERTWEMMKGTVMLGITLPFVAAVGIGLLIRKMLMPILRISEQVKQVAKGDLTIDTISIKNNDEIGELAHGFNTMVGSLRRVIDQVQDNAHVVASTANELAANSEQVSRTTEQITATIQEVATGASEQVASATRGTTEVHTVSNEIQYMNSKMEMVIRSSEQATRTSQSGNQVVTSAIHHMNLINERTMQINAVVQSLLDKSQVIGSIVSTITDIAAHTKILALNATIEAARAGEHGKGFAIVASEVRKLADETGHSADKIVSLIAEIQGDIANAAVASSEGTDAVQQGIDMVANAGQSFEEIESAVVGVSDYINGLTSTLQKIDSGMQSLVEIINGISRISERTSSNSKNVSYAAEEQYASMEEVSAVTSTLSQMAEDLQQAVDMFKTTPA